MKKNLADELYFWQERGADADWFTAQLFNLWMKADPGNKARLSLGFPEECAMIESWYKSDDPEKWYKKNCSQELNI